jgi:methylated-DNA-[protein]-cysteine S-methyltransferase
MVGMTVLDAPTIPSPLGPLALAGGPRGLRRLRFADRALGGGRRVGGPDGGAAASGASAGVPEELLDATRGQLDAYFAGELRAFDLPLDLGGTPFQRAVWERLLAVPYGETTTYAAIAAELGRPSAVRAVGAAVGRTPVAIVVPCHRVLGSDGALTGYAGGVDRKRALLELERRGPAALGAPANGGAATSGG